MVKENYSYPLLPDWSTEEIIIACEFYAEVEKYNTNGGIGRNFWRNIKIF